VTGPVGPGGPQDAATLAGASFVQCALPGNCKHHEGSNVGVHGTVGSPTRIFFFFFFFWEHK
jgi:hypothetical protein